MLLQYDESDTKAALRPRHPIVCIQDMAGIGVTMFFLSHSAHLIVQSYLLSIALLYTASAVHHWLKFVNWSRRLDHIMIFVVIAMSALPYWTLYPPMQWVPAGPMLVVLIIILGIIVKSFSFFPKVISSVLYTIAGLPMFVHLLWQWSAIQAPFNVLLFLGIALYTFQMLIYTFEWFDFKPEVFGFREVQHCFLLTATTVHSKVAITLIG